MAPAPPALVVARATGSGTQRAEARVETGGAGCPADLAARLGLVPLAPAVLDKLAKSLPAGCRVLAVELAEGMAVASSRYEAAGEDGAFAACEPGVECAAGGCAFPVAPIFRRAGKGGMLLGIFQVTASGARGGALVVEAAPAP